MTDNSNIPNRVFSMLLLTSQPQDSYTAATINNCGSYFIETPEMAGIVATALMTHRPLQQCFGGVTWLYNTSTNFMEEMRAFTNITL